MEWAARLLKREYGSPRHHNKDDPLDELVFILLSSKTAEGSYLRTYDALKARFPTWFEILESREGAVAEVIREGGLSTKKELHLRALFAKIDTEIGRAHFAALGSMPTEKATALLSDLPGIGLKSARCVLMYSLDRKVFPVDTHCRRVLSRLGLIAFERLSEDAQNRIQSVVPPRLRYDLHVNLVAHGRAVCTARVPRCLVCLLRSRCDYFAERTRQVDGGVQLLRARGRSRPTMARRVRRLSGMRVSPDDPLAAT